MNAIARWSNAQWKGLKMQFDVEELEGLKRKINITIPEDVVSKRVEDAYKVLNKKTNIPGFRPGKIPQKILEKQVPMQSFTEMFQELMQEYYEQALQKTGLRPTGQPEIDHSGMQDIKRDEPLKFAVILDIKPELNVKDYKGLKFKKKEAVVKEEDVEETLVKVLSHQGSLEDMPAGYVVKDGDILTLDFEGTMNGQPLENGNAKDHEMRVGEKKMIPGFEDQLIGHVQDEDFEVSAVLPADWNQKMRRISFPIPGASDEKQEDDRAIFKVHEDSGFEPEKAIKEWREKAVFNTTGYMMLESIAAAENIHLTQQDMEGEYELLAKQTKQKVEEVQKRIMSNPDSLGQTTIKLLGQKAMNFIYSNCEIEFYKEG